MSYEKEMQKLNKKIDDLTEIIISNKENTFLLNNNKRVFMRHFINGVFRGFGMAIGFTILVAIIIYVLQKIVLLNLPTSERFVSGNIVSQLF